MPRKRRASTPTLEADEDEFASEGKYSKDDLESRAPRNAANARERARMRVLSKAFCRLKTTLPWVPADTKLSKLDTLRLAATYIAHLRAVLRDDADPHSETRSLSLALVSFYLEKKSYLRCNCLINRLTQKLDRALSIRLRIRTNNDLVADNLFDYILLFDFKSNFL